jgi:S1-C subfamily serine protease
MSLEKDALSRSIVKVRALVPENAFTAGILGMERVGNGVVINSDGLILTIGYLITEATDVWLTMNEGQELAGHALAYDQVTDSAWCCRWKIRDLHRCR